MMSSSSPSSSATFERFKEFCGLTSLHGFPFCFRDGKPLSHTVFWMLIILASTGCVSFLLYFNVLDFIEASVSFNLQSPTNTLDDVYFPSVALCNMNLLRKSFIKELIKDPLMSNVSYNKMHDFVEDMFVKGQASEPTPEEVRLTKAVLESETYNLLFEELLATHTKNESNSLSNIPVTKWHSLFLATVNNETREGYKRGFVNEVASQFRDGEMIANMRFRGYGINYNPGFSTDLSETCVWLTPFVKKPKNSQELWTIEKGVYNGANNGFQMLLDAEAFDYASTITGSEGFVMTILHQLDIPILKQTGINIQPGQSVQIAVTPTLINTTSACKRRFTPEKRQCFFEDEIMLRHLPGNLSYRYEMSNCLFEATLQKVERECNCTPRFFIDVVEGFNACEGKNKLCMNALTDEMGSVRSIDDNGVTKTCLAACIDQTHSFLVTEAAYPNVMSFYQSKEYCITLEKLKKSCGGDRRDSLDESQPDLCSSIEAVSALGIECQHELGDEDSHTGQLVEKMQAQVAQYARQNMALVNVFIREPYCKKYVTEEKITEISFAGTVGGLLGLFMGFSFVSAVEVLYYIFLGCGRDSTSLSSAGLSPSTLVKVRPWSSSSLARTILGDQKERDRECRCQCDCCFRGRQPHRKKRDRFRTGLDKATEAAEAFRY